MTTNHCWDIDREATISEIGEWCLTHRRVDRVHVVARPDQDLPRKLAEPRVEHAVNQIFAGKILESVWAKAWAGTELFRNRAAKVWVIAFDRDVLERMIAAQNSLRQWRHVAEPPLPEDVCLYRIGDSLPTFVSVTHDSEAWLFDPTAGGAHFARPAELPLPSDLIPPPPNFLRS